MAEQHQIPNAWIGKQVLVRLASNLDYKGTLLALDGYMNVALQSAIECLGDEVRQKPGDVFIRGNHGTPLEKFYRSVVLYISPL